MNAADYESLRPASSKIRSASASNRNTSYPLHIISGLLKHPSGFGKRLSFFLILVPIISLAVWFIWCFVSLLDDPSRNLFWPGDYGIFLIDMHNAASFGQSVGISSRFEWSHPGPMNYYLLLPFYLGNVPITVEVGGQALLALSR